MMEIGKEAKYAVVTVNPGQWGLVEMVLKMYGGGEKKYSLSDVGWKESSGKAVPYDGKKDQDLTEVTTHIIRSGKWPDNEETEVRVFQVDLCNGEIVDKSVRAGEGGSKMFAVSMGYQEQQAGEVFECTEHRESTSDRFMQAKDLQGNWVDVYTVFKVDGQLSTIA